jgi:pyruvate-ferredoxin/flavodoxin oxidoreductase
MARKFKSMDGNNAAAYVSYAFTEVAAIYPITPSVPDGRLLWTSGPPPARRTSSAPPSRCRDAVRGRRSGTVHGSLAAGALTTTYTASQGLLLMIPNMYKIAGELLPAVFHVSARTVATHALNIFGDHSDVYGLPSDRLCHAGRGQPQEVMDLAPWRIWPPSRAASRSSTSSTASAPPTRSRRSPSGTMPT